MGSETGKGDMTLYNEQKLANFFSADWYVLCVDSAIPFEQ